MIEQLSLITTTILFWLSPIGTIVLYLHPRIGNYKIQGEQILSYTQAGTVLFTGFFSSAILYWSLFESFLFKNDPSFTNLFAEQVDNPHFLTSMTLYNWTLPMFITLFVGVIMCIFVAKYKDKYLAPQYKKLLIVVFAFLALFSTFRILASLSSYILPIKYLLNYFSGIDSSAFVVFLLVVFILWSAIGGLTHIKKFANICSIFVAVYSIVLVTKICFEYDVLQYVLNVFGEFGALVTNTSFIGEQFKFNNPFLEKWTMLFAQSYVVSAFPFLYFVYITLQGRTVREFIRIYTVFLTIPTFLIFLLNSTVVQLLVKEKQLNITADTFFDLYPIMFDTVGLGYLPAILLFLSMTTLIVTSVDSIIYACAKYLAIPTEGKRIKDKKMYILFATAYVIMLGTFLLYVLSFKSKPALAIRLFELNFYGGIAVFLPLLYMIFKVFVAFKKDPCHKC